jgi:hypothetical protein
MPSIFLPRFLQAHPIHTLNHISTKPGSSLTRFRPPCFLLLKVEEAAALEEELLAGTVRTTIMLVFAVPDFGV